MDVVYVDEGVVYVRDTLFDTWQMKCDGGKWEPCKRPKGLRGMKRYIPGSDVHTLVMENFRNRFFE